MGDRSEFSLTDAKGRRWVYKRARGAPGATPDGTWKARGPEREPVGPELIQERIGGFPSKIFISIEGRQAEPGITADAGVFEYVRKSTPE
jgi:hypothetical protein